MTAGWRTRWGDAVRAVTGWPIVIRDLRSAQRNPRIVATTLGAVVLLSLAIVVGVIAVTSGGARDPELLGQILVQIVYWAGVVVVVGAFPGMASVPLVAERERKSLDLVHMSQLSSLAMAFGTAAASLANGLVMLAVLLPTLVLALVFGGVPWWIVAEMAYVILLAGLLSAAIGVHASAVSKTTVRAVLQGYLGALLLPGLMCGCAGMMFFAFLEFQDRGVVDAEVQRVSVMLLLTATVAATAFGLLALLLARNALLPPGGNRATPLRWYVLALLFWWTLSGLTFLIQWPNQPWAGRGTVDLEVWRAFGTAQCLLLWLAALAAVVAFSTEDPPGRRVERRAQGWRGWRAAGRLFFPGRERGAWFAILASGAALLGSGWAIDAFEASGTLGKASLRAWYRPGGIGTLMALGLWSQLVAVAGAGVVLRALLGSAARARGALVAGFFGLQILAHVGLAWDAGELGHLELGVWNGTLVAVWALFHGAWAAPGQLDSMLDPVMGGAALPFPFIFALVHLIPGCVLLCLGGLWRDRAPGDSRAVDPAAVAAPSPEPVLAVAAAESPAGAEPPAGEPPPSEPA